MKTYVDSVKIETNRIMLYINMKYYNFLLLYSIADFRKYYIVYQPQRKTNGKKRKNRFFFAKLFRENTINGLPIIVMIIKF